MDANLELAFALCTSHVRVGRKCRADGNGIYYYRARYYNSILGRFISEDPAHVGGNFYAYAADSPTNLVDPSGLAPDWWNTLKGYVTTPAPPPPPKPPCVCPGLDPFLDYMRQHYPTHTPSHMCATAVKTGLEKGAGFPYWLCDAKNCGQGLLDRGFTDVTVYGDSDPNPLMPGDIIVMQPAVAPDGTYLTNPAGHIAVWDGSHWISDFTQQNPNGQVYNIPLTDFKYYRYPCGCSN